MRPLLAVLVACITAPAWAFDTSELMAMLAKQGSGSATFSEQRFVRELDAPVAASGTLSFEAPDKLSRRTVTPRAESMVVDGNTLTLSRGNRTRTLTLDSMPELQGMVEAMRGTLSGNAASLQRYFRSTVQGSAAAWTLDLQPVDARLRAQVLGVRIQGQQGQVRGIEMEFAGGDRSVTRIVPDASAIPSAR